MTQNTLCNQQSDKASFKGLDGVSATMHPKPPKLRTCLYSVAVELKIIRAAIEPPNTPTQGHKPMFEIIFLINAAIIILGV